jgi:hypothetical protein
VRRWWGNGAVRRGTLLALLYFARLFKSSCSWPTLITNRSTRPPARPPACLLACPPARAPLVCRITDLEDLLQRRERILEVVEAEADELVAKHGTPRRTAIVTDGAWGGRGGLGSGGGCSPLRHRHWQRWTAVAMAASTWLHLHLHLLTLAGRTACCARAPPAPVPPCR